MQVTGKVTFQFDGKTLRSLPGAKIIFGGVERKPVNDDQGGVHFSEKRTHGGAEFVIPHTSDTNIDELRLVTAATLIAETDTGKQFMGRGAFITNSLELSANDNGEINVSVACMPLEEV